VVSAFLSFAGAKVQQKKQSAKFLTDYFSLDTKKSRFCSKKELKNTQFRSSFNKFECLSVGYLVAGASY